MRYLPFRYVCTSTITFLVLLLLLWPSAALLCYSTPWAHSNTRIKCIFRLIGVARPYRVQNRGIKQQHATLHARNHSIIFASIGWWSAFVYSFFRSVKQHNQLAGGGCGGQRNGLSHESLAFSASTHTANRAYLCLQFYRSNLDNVYTWMAWTFSV